MGRRPVVRPGPTCTVRHPACRRRPGAWAANRAMQPLAMDRPLWRADIVHALPDTRFAVLLVMHHILADGVAGLALGRPAARSDARLPPGNALDEVRHTVAGSSGAGPSTAAGGPRLDPTQRPAREYPSPGRARERPRRNQHFMGRSPAESPRRHCHADRPAAQIRDGRRRRPYVTRTAHALGVTVNDLLLDSRDERLARPARGSR